MEELTSCPSKLPVRYFCQDETRVGLKTLERRVITACRVKPEGKVQWEFKAFYVYGVVEPLTGSSFFLEFSHLDSECFQVYLNKLSEQYQDSINIIQLDNATAHTAKKIEIPNNIILLFQPPHSPEVNPIERVWQYLKDKLSWNIYSTLEDLRQTVRDIINNFEQEIIMSLTGWDYILDALDERFPLSI